jgi:hypothetical protein
VTKRLREREIGDLALPLGFGGVGMILLAVPLMDLTLAAVDGDDAGAASGVFNTVQQLGSALGVALVGVVFFGVLGADPSPARYEDALLAGGGVTMTAFALAALGRRAPARTCGAPRRSADSGGRGAKRGGMRRGRVGPQKRPKPWAARSHLRVMRSSTARRW